MVLRDEDGRARGYCAVHGFIQTHLGRRTLIIRFEIAAEKAWRRRTFAGPFISKTLTQLCLRYPGIPRYMFACFVHPSAYVALCRHVPLIWPRPKTKTPAKIQALMHSLARQFDIEVSDGIAQVGWIANADPVPERVHPLAAFYLERNPDYVAGKGLMTVMPLSGRELMIGLARYARSLQRRRQRRPQMARTLAR